MQEHSYPMGEAFRYVKNCRYFINPNDGFKRQLIKFSKELSINKKYMVSQNMEQVN